MKEPGLGKRSMRILIISAHFPYPEVDHAGGTNLFNYIKALSRNHSISLASRILPEEEIFIPLMHLYCETMEVTSALRTLWSKIARTPLMLVYPREVVQSYSLELGRKLRQLCEQQEFDLVLVENMYMARYWRFAKRTKRILDEVDVHTLVTRRRYLQAEHIWSRAYYWFEWYKTSRMELRVCREADLVFTRSESNQSYLLKRLPETPVQVLPPWFSGLTAFNNITAKQIEANTLLFLGNMSRIENIEAATYLYRKVLPLVRSAIPDIILYIVGSNPPEEIRDWSDEERVFVTGYVEDISDYYARCAVFVAPLFVGGGIIIKILDAMAAGRPVVTTEIGNEGINALPDQEICIANTAEDIANRVIELLTDTQAWERIAPNGREFVRRNYDWPTIERNLEIACTDLVGES